MSRLYHPGRYSDAYITAPVRSTASIIAIFCAILSFFFSARGTESLGFILSLVAIGAGLIGGVKALSPRVSGGILSIVAVLLGVVAFFFAFIALLF